MCGKCCLSGSTHRLLRAAWMLCKAHVSTRVLRHLSYLVYKLCSSFLFGIAEQPLAMEYSLFTTGELLVRCLILALSLPTECIISVYCCRYNTLSNKHSSNVLDFPVKKFLFPRAILLLLLCCFSKYGAYFFL